MTESKNNHFYSIVIGAGSGGMTVAIGMSMLGRKTALIEGHHVGGDCTNVGCVPSKTLIHLAREFKPGMDPDQVLKEVIRKRDALREEETHEVQNNKEITFVRGWASFNGPREIAVDQPDGSLRHLTGDHIVIATGARPRWLEVPGLPTERALTNESLFDLTQVPKHLAIIGAGIVALEMGFALRKLGVQVSMFALDPRPLATAIPEASDAIQAELERKGIVTYYNATAKSYDESTQTLTIQQEHREVQLRDVDKVLIAVGRVRNLEKLNLEKAGVKADPKTGVAVDGYGQTNIKGVYAIGDVTPTSAFTHSANAQGRRVVQRIAYPLLPLSKQEPLFPSAVFSDPEVASVGLSPKELAAQCHPEAVRRIRVDFKTQTDRGYTDGIENGFILLDVVRLTGKILHATIVGPRASEMISFFTLAMSKQISLFKIGRLVYPYPTFSSGILKAGDFFLSETLRNLGREVLAYLRYRFARPPTRNL